MLQGDRLGCIFVHFMIIIIIIVIHKVYAPTIPEDKSTAELWYRSPTGYETNARFVSRVYVRSSRPL